MRELQCRAIEVRSSSAYHCYGTKFRLQINGDTVEAVCARCGTVWSIEDLAKKG